MAISLSMQGPSAVRLIADALQISATQIRQTNVVEYSEDALLWTEFPLARARFRRAVVRYEVIDPIRLAHSVRIQEAADAV